MMTGDLGLEAGYVHKTLILAVFYSKIKSIPMTVLPAVVVLSGAFKRE
jgi:hypothetical protein